MGKVCKIANKILILIDILYQDLTKKTKNDIK